MTDAIQAQLLAARRDQILDAAATVFAERGFHPTTIREIARAAGVADGTIYNYFENKTALLFGILDRMKASAVPDDAFMQFSAGEFRSFLKAYLRHPLMVPKADNFALFRVVISEILVNRELRERYYRHILEPTMAMAEAAFQQWEAQHALKPINIRLTTRAVSGMVLGLILAQIIGDELLEAQWEALPDFLADLLMDGIGNDTS